MTRTEPGHGLFRPVRSPRPIYRPGDRFRNHVFLSPILWVEKVQLFVFPSPRSRGRHPNLLAILRTEMFCSNK